MNGFETRITFYYQMTDYLPLRVHSVFSRGAGAVAAAELAELLQRQRAPFLPLADPHSLIGWESFHGEAKRRGLKPLLGTEIRIREKGALLLFPLSRSGYLALVAGLNARQVPDLTEMATVLLPAAPDERFRDALRRRAGAGLFFLGLEWQSPRWVSSWAAKTGLPLLWANPLRWLGQTRRYGVVRAVFRHLPLQETLRTDVALEGLLPSAAILRRWGEAGRQALKNSWRLAESIGFTFDRIGEQVAAEGNHLRPLVESRLRQTKSTAAARQRAQNELAVIEKMDFAPYFLLAREVSEFCRQQRIFHQVRGSATSSYILYLLGVSRIDPLPHGLLFERFVNSLRDDLPDIDIDIDSSRRAEVLRWLFDRHQPRLAFVSTHKFFGARSALYETLRAAGYSPEEAHGLSKNLPLFATPAELRGRGGQKHGFLHECAAELHGVYKELSLHVGGLVWTRESAAALFPLAHSPQGYPQAVWNKDTMERLHVFKLDILGVRGFDVIAPLARQGGIDHNDVEVWAAIGRAATTGCFQIESPLARENLRRARPKNLAELAVCLAIIRPGPARSGMKQAYLENRPPFHPLLAELFPNLRGALVFEEQIAVLLQRLTGWSLEKAEKARRELKKKSVALKQEFFDCSVGRGWSVPELERFWQLLHDFSAYAFCQAHSIAYAHSAFLSAWLRTKQPLLFFCRLLNAGGGYYSQPVYIAEAQKAGLRFLPPDINRSAAGFAPENGAIRTGLLQIKGIGEKMTAAILEQRRLGYAGLEEFVQKTGAGTGEIAALMAAGAFASLGIDRLPAVEKRTNWQKYLGFLPE